MGSDKDQDKEAHNNELPQHRVSLPRYYLAHWPVTVAQFAAFQRKDLVLLKSPANHPVVCVNWYEAIDYCRWLDERLRQLAPTRLAGKQPLSEAERAFWQDLADGSLRVGLPSEAEWEKAARGTDGRIYPWGNKLDSERANYDDTGLNWTSTVGCFPGGASPYGCEEMSGNVWEWTRSLYDEYPYPEDGLKRWVRENFEAEGRRVVRGGSFGVFGSIRCAARFRDDPDLSGGGGGFRVVVSPLVFSG